MITADYHVHSKFSSDSESTMESMIEKAISLGMERICFTDHMDYDFPVYNGYTFVFDPDEYFDTLNILKVRYQDKIKVLIGVELGLQPYLVDRYHQLLSKYPFDFAIGSSHLVNGIDPYRKEYWEGKSKEEGMRRYFQSIIDNVKTFKDFQIYGHLDYAIRYAPDTNEGYTYERFSTIIDTMLKTIIEHDKGIEINTSGFKYGLGHPHPHSDIVRRYKELGGELITIGSDGHKPEHLGYDFKKAEELLLSLGFRYYTVFEKMKPIFIKLN
ncbi:phosphoesterase [Anaerocolumna cellulosilytica]|uniref:Histidinol-phosphatase n=1 Tax=Anaerocolumna cellulosilytica TaxID=433286 RepID=A0A6S6QYI8_9FIRM|nr:histidinol-phosphatase HisJ family protein [Anaerocolumna cellulosilytica]MBB5193960.1 histidinol-phosphatase (PHP family) [Anaerocolumna cellulosilytica]BCJ94826.1 phosphoesterase [Anaerocolumna cellulosilytica]